MKAKKIFKGMTAAAIAAVLAASMVPMTAFAAAPANNGKFTIAAQSGISNTDTVSIYKVASLDTDGKYVWTWNTNIFKSGVDTSGFTDFDTLAGYTEAANSKELKALAANLARSVDTAKATRTGAASTTFDNLEQGYYLVTVTSSSSDVIYQPALIAIKDNDSRELTQLKKSEIVFDKSITGVTPSQAEYTGHTNTAEAAQVKVGDTVKFTLKTQIPNYDVAIKNSNEYYTAFTPFTITDTPTKMTIDQADGKVVVYRSEDDVLNTGSDTPLTKGTDFTTKDTDYTITFDSTGKMTIVLNKDMLLSDTNNDGVSDYADDYIFVTLEATLDSAANIDIANPNNADVTYSNDYATGGGSKVKRDDVNVFTTKLTINKVDADNTETKLENAEFELRQGGKVIATLKTDANGQASYSGLSAGEYQLVETVAPAGYKLDTTPKTIEIGANISEKTVTFTATEGVEADTTGFKTQITNSMGQTLPGTGGMGTVIFTVAGVSVVALAGIMLVVYMKKRKADEE